MYKLVQDGYIDAFGGPISTGKEANVYTALGGDTAHEELGGTESPEVAVKVYRINASDFKDMRGTSTATRASRASARTRRRSSPPGSARSSPTSSGRAPRRPGA